MGILKSYGRQVRPSGEVGAVAMDVGSAGSGLRSIGAAATGIGIDYTSRLEKETTAAQIADASSNLKLSWDAAKQTMGTMEDPDEINAFYDKWEADQKKTIAGSKMTPRARATIDNSGKDIFADMRISATGAGGYAQKAQIKQNDIPWIKMQSLAVSGEGGINPETGEEMAADEAYRYATEKRMGLGTVSSESGIKSVSEFNSKRNYKILEGDIANLELARARGGTTKQYLEGLDKVATDAEAAEMGETSRKNITNQVTFKSANAVTSQNKAAQKAINNMDVKIKSGEFEAEDYNAIVNTYGEGYAQLISDSTEESFRDLAVSNVKASELLKIADKAVKGEMSWPEAIRKMGKIDAGSLKYTAALVMADNYMELAETSGLEVNAYEGWWKDDRKIKSDGFISRVVDNVAKYSSMNGPDPKFINDSFADAVEWRKSGKYKGEEVTESEFFSKKFNDQATMLVQKISAPQVQPTVEIKRLTKDGRTAVFNSETKEFIRYE